MTLDLILKIVSTIADVAVPLTVFWFGAKIQKQISVQNKQKEILAETWKKVSLLTFPFIFKVDDLIEKWKMEEEYLDVIAFQKYVNENWVWYSDKLFYELAKISAIKNTLNDMHHANKDFQETQRSLSKSVKSVREQIRIEFGLRNTKPIRGWK